MTPQTANPMHPMHSSCILCIHPRWAGPAGLALRIRVVMERGGGVPRMLRREEKNSKGVLKGNEVLKGKGWSNTRGCQGQAVVNGKG